MVAITASPESSTRSSKPSRKLTKGADVAEWIEFHCVHTKAEWIGKPFTLLPWQKEWLLRLFEVDAAGHRKKRWALLGRAKKNGKTELAAALALYFLIGDGEPAPLVVTAAASEEQADLVFGAAATMCRMSPTLSEITEVYDKEIRVPMIPGAELKRVAAAVGTNDGPNIYVAILDELHEWVGVKGKQVWDVLTNGGVSRREPLVLQITTAGHDLDGTICGREYLYGKQLQSGEIKDDGYLFDWTEAPEGADWRDPAVWRAANPSWGATIPNPKEYYEDQTRRKTEAVFRRYFLNQWTRTEEIWEVAEKWDSLQSDLALDPNEPLFVGIDVGIKHDSSAVVATQFVEGRLVQRCRSWTNPHPRRDPQHDLWKLDIVKVENHLRELYSEYRGRAREKPGPLFNYDPNKFERSAQTLEGEGLNMVEFPQTLSRLVPMSQNFYELAMTGVLAHDGDPVFRDHVRNVVAKEEDRGWRISKPKGSARNIDAAIAAAMAVFEASRQPEQPPEPRIRIIGGPDEEQ